MTRTTPLPHECPETLKMLGDFWILYIIDVMREDEVRFSQLKRQVKGINPVTLTNRLKKLEAANIIKRDIETVDKQSVTYCLTAVGKETLPIIDAHYHLARILQTHENNT